MSTPEGQLSLLADLGPRPLPAVHPIAQQWEVWEEACLEATGHLAPIWDPASCGGLGTQQAHQLEDAVSLILKAQGNECPGQWEKASWTLGGPHEAHEDPGQAG